jgi:hypothetical protein
MLLQGIMDFREEKQAAVGGFFGGFLNGQTSSPERFSEYARRICKRMVQPDPEKRISAQDAIRDSWFEYHQDAIRRNPSRRQTKQSNDGYPQQAPPVDPSAHVLKQAKQEAYEKDRRIKSLEQKVTALQQQKIDQDAQSVAPAFEPPEIKRGATRAVNESTGSSSKGFVLRPGLRCRYYSSSYGWMLATVQSTNADDSTFNLDMRQHAAPQNIAPPDRPEAEMDYWPNGTMVFYQSTTYTISKEGLPAVITGFNAVDFTYNLDIRDHAQIDRIRARIGEHMPAQHENPIAGMRTEKTSPQGNHGYGYGDYGDSGSQPLPVPVQARGSTQARLAEGWKCMLDQEGYLTYAVVEGFNESYGCYSLLVDPNGVRRSMTVRSDDIRAPGNAADAWPNGTPVMYKSTSMDSWLPGVITSFNPGNNTYNLDLREGAPPERIRPR